MISVHSAHMSTHHDLDQWNLNQDKRLPKGLWKIWSDFSLKWHSCIFTINVEVKKTVLGCDGSNYVWSSMFDCLKPKIGCSSLITKSWTCSRSFDVRKTDVWVCSLRNLVNLVKALLGSKFNVWSFEAQNRVFKFDNQ